MCQLCQVLGPLFLVLILQLSNHVPQGLMGSLHLSILLRVVRHCGSLPFPKLSTQLGHNLACKAHILVSYELLWGTKYRDKPLVEALCDCGHLLVFSDICPHVPGEVINYHQDILDLWCLIQIHS